MNASNYYGIDAHLKNDKVDALHLAELLRIGMIPPAHATGPEGRYVKELGSGNPETDP